MQGAIHCPMPGWSQGFSDKGTWKRSQYLFLSLKHVPDTVAWALSGLTCLHAKCSNHVRVGGHSETFCWVEDPQEDFPLPCLHPFVWGKLVPDLPRAWTQLTLEPVRGQATYEPLISLQLLLGNWTCPRRRIRALNTKLWICSWPGWEKPPCYRWLHIYFHQQKYCHPSHWISELGIKKGAASTW